MSKSRYNGVDLLEVTEKYGVDAIRLFMLQVHNVCVRVTYVCEGGMCVCESGMCVCESGMCVCEGGVCV